MKYFINLILILFYFHNTGFSQDTLEIKTDSIKTLNLEIPISFIDQIPNYWKFKNEKVEINAFKWSEDQDYFIQIRLTFSNNTRVYNFYSDIVQKVDFVDFEKDKIPEIFIHGTNTGSGDDYLYMMYSITEDGKMVEIQVPYEARKESCRYPISILINENLSVIFPIFSPNDPYKMPTTGKVNIDVYSYKNGHFIYEKSYVDKMENYVNEDY